ncbi:hypothetical protein E1295_42050 [Nonomuraea mesophila]|uniref:Uncharacterized protein n=1 Tax=Nonomuraea mesophila TaxID=2530382 RepID=A0A4R5EA88_9ACTN|nr:hypothetical protein [Nonomuraea mesophila]TDE29044.1 hypothetical protein E1295_42050 [Nonomuraea mesophila]
MHRLAQDPSRANPPFLVSPTSWGAGHVLARPAGHTGYVITALTAQVATTAVHRRDGIDACIRYLTDNLEYLSYDQAPEAG